MFRLLPASYYRNALQAFVWELNTLITNLLLVVPNHAMSHWFCLWVDWHIHFPRIVFFVMITYLGVVVTDMSLVSLCVGYEWLCDRIWEETPYGALTQVQLFVLYCPNAEMCFSNGVTACIVHWSQKHSCTYHTMCSETMTLCAHIFIAALCTCVLAVNVFVR